MDPAEITPDPVPPAKWPVAVAQAVPSKPAVASSTESFRIICL